MMYSFSTLLFIILTAPLLTNCAKYTLCTTLKNLSECQQINRTNDIQCIAVEDELSCIERIDGGRAHFASVSAEGAFLGASKNNLITLATFELQEEPTKYDIETAIVTNRYIDNGLISLRNFSYCHPGFDSSDVNPFLLVEFEREVLSENGVDICANNTLTLIEKHIKAVHDFFGSSCRPSRWTQDTEFDTKLKQKYSRLSELCSTSAYLSNTGKAFTQALNCVVNSNSPAVAITTISAIESLKETQNFSVYTICRNRTTSDANEILCNWSAVPNKIVIANRNTYADLPVEFQEWFEEYLAASTLAAKTELTSSQKEQMRTILFPQPYQNYKIIVEKSELPSLYETTSVYRQNLTTQQSRQCRTEMRWCTASNDEQRKCEAWSRASLHNAIQPVLQCIQASNKRECIDVIKMNNADIVTIGADFGYFAKLAGLEAIAFPETEREFLIRTILVVQPNITRPENLRGKKGCFSRYGNAAWLSFINVTRSVILDKNTCEYGQLLNDALGRSCMPGAGSLKLENLCSLCVSNTTQDPTCATDATNRYSGNQGALNCLRDVGDFAVITKTEGLILPENVRVMCRNSTLADSSFGLDVDDNCFLSVITTDEIVSRRGDAKNFDIQLMLRESDRRFAANSRTPFKLFGTFDGIPNMLFRDSTPGLDLPNSQNQWIKNYQSLFRHIDSCKAGSSVVKTPSFAVLTLISLMLPLLIKSIH